MRSCAFGVAEIELLERGGPLAVAVVRGALGRNARRRLARTWRLSRRMSSAQPFGSSCSRSSGSVKARRGLAKRCFGGRETSATRVEMSLEGSGELLWGSIAVDRPRISIERPTDQPKASTDQPRTQAGSTSNTYGSASNIDGSTSNIDGSTSNADRINLKHRPDQHQTTTTDQPSASNERLAPSMDSTQCVERAPCAIDGLAGESYGPVGTRPARPRPLAARAHPNPGALVALLLGARQQAFGLRCRMSNTTVLTRTDR